VEFRADSAELIGLSSPGDKVRAGARLPLRVILRPYAGAEFARTLDIDVPQTLAGRAMKIEVASGMQVKPEVPRAEDLRGFVENLRTYYPASSIVVSLTTRDDGASLHGRLIRNLPASALDALKTTNQTRRADPFHVIKRTIFPRSPSKWKNPKILFDDAKLRPAAARMEVDGHLPYGQILLGRHGPQPRPLVAQGIARLPVLPLEL
jgi:hypothetical protein